MVSVKLSLTEGGVKGFDNNLISKVSSKLKKCEITYFLHLLKIMKNKLLFVFLHICGSGYWALLLYVVVLGVRVWSYVTLEGHTIIYSHPFCFVKLFVCGEVHILQ